MVGSLTLISWGTTLITSVHHLKSEANWMKMWVVSTLFRLIRRYLFISPAKTQPIKWPVYQCMRQHRRFQRMWCYLAGTARLFSSCSKNSIFAVDEHNTENVTSGYHHRYHFQGQLQNGKLRKTPWWIYLNLNWAYCIYVGLLRISHFIIFCQWFIQTDVKVS